MLRIITQKCPCGYLFKKKEQIEIRTEPASGIITCKPGKGPVKHDKPTTKKHVVGSKTLFGDKSFKTVSVLTDFYPTSNSSNRMALIVCPKCGTLLMPKYAMTVEERDE